MSAGSHHWGEKETWEALCDDAMCYEWFDLSSYWDLTSKWSDQPFESVVEKNNTSNHLKIKKPGWLFSS